MTQDYEERCIACDVTMKNGDEYLPEINGGSIHYACIGPEPECFVDLETGDQLPEKPEPLIWGD